jgi:anti-sigma regulatory factor (Ser/Thr protein kinase)
MSIDTPGTAIDLEFRPEGEAIRTARNATEVLEPLIPPEQLDDVRLLVSELVTNSVRHARFAPSDWLRLRLAASDGNNRVEVHDPGPGFEATAPARPEPMAESGWGMYLVEQLADRWGIDREDGTCVWFELQAS